MTKHFPTGSGPIEIEPLPVLLTNKQREQSDRMNAYYRFQSKIYDLTRWSFLFGRRRLIRKLAETVALPASILEVGCGTGHNLSLLARRFPDSRLMGVDVSDDMLQLASRRLQSVSGKIRLFQGAYGKRAADHLPQPEIIVCSYVLSMINPQWNKLIRQAWEHLPVGGWIAVVDFHRSPLGAFRRHMSGHHVRMDGHLLPELLSHFTIAVREVRPVYFGCWQYFLFIGQKSGGKKRDEAEAHGAVN